MARKGVIIDSTGGFSQWVFAGFMVKSSIRKIRMRCTMSVLVFCNGIKFALANIIECLVMKKHEKEII